jgi:hypothetical protein
MMLAFLIDQAQLLTCNVVQTAVKKKKRLSAYYQTIREIFNFFIFESWAEVYSAIAYDIQAINAKDVLNRPNSS